MQALADAKKKLKEAEEEKTFVQVDCEQMRHVVQVAVQEKAKAQERETEVRRAALQGGQGSKGGVMGLTKQLLCALLLTVPCCSR